jgi:uncharacterized membrane protein required for colicin V production
MSVISVVLDLAAVLFILIMTLIGAGKGFLKGLVGIIGILIAVVVAYFLAAPVANLLETLFHTTTSLTSSLTGYFQGFEGLNAEVGDSSLAQAMTDNLHIPALISEFIFGKVLVVTGYDTTMTFAEIFGKTFAILIMQVASAIVVFILFSIILSILVRILTHTLKHVSLLNYTNIFLGLLLGALKAGIVLCIVVFLLYLIPYQGLQDVLANTVFIQNVEVFLLKIFPIA